MEKQGAKTKSRVVTGRVEHACHDRQLRLIHIQLSAVLRRVGRRRASLSQRPDWNRRSRRPAARSAGSVTGTVHTGRSRHLCRRNQAFHGKAADLWCMPWPPKHRRRPRRAHCSRATPDAWKSQSYHHRWTRCLPRIARAISSHSLSLIGDQRDSGSWLSGLDQPGCPQARARQRWTASPVWPPQVTCCSKPSTTHRRRSSDTRRARRSWRSPVIWTCAATSRST